MKLAELTGKAIFFDQGGGQSDIISLTAFFTKENHGERTLLIFYQKNVVSFFILWSPIWTIRGVSRPELALSRYFVLV